MLIIFGKQDSEKLSKVFFDEIAHHTLKCHCKIRKQPFSTVKRFWHQQMQLDNISLHEVVFSFPPMTKHSRFLAPFSRTPRAIFSQIFRVISCFSPSLIFRVSSKSVHVWGSYNRNTLTAMYVHCASSFNGPSLWTVMQAYCDYQAASHR